MINENMFKEIMISQKKIFLDRQNIFEREILNEAVKMSDKLKEILVITGLRRVGKSTLLKLIWDKSKSKNRLTDDQFLYCNFEDERLINFTADDFSKLMEVYYETCSPDKNKKIYLFLDEIQNVKYWEKWLNRLREEDKFKIFITGSNSSLLSGELSASLTGRHIPIVLHPLCFYEYFTYFKGKQLSSQSFYDQQERAKIKKALVEYSQLGGMPEYLKTKSPELIQEYFKNIILRDIVNRYNIKYKQGLKELAHILLSNSGQIYSLRNLSRSIEIKNINTIKNYLQYLENSFLFFKVPLFSFSYKQQVYNPDKIYIADLAFYNNLAFKATDNFGVIYENLVFLSLRHKKNNEIFYYKTKNNLEVDFAVKEGHKLANLIQVCHKADNIQTVDREEKALLLAMEELKMPKGIIINEDLETEKKISGKKIVYIPLWKWLLTQNIIN